MSGRPDPGASEAITRTLLAVGAACLLAFTLLLDREDPTNSPPPSSPDDAGPQDMAEGSLGAGSSGTSGRGGAARAGVGPGASQQAEAVGVAPVVEGSGAFGRSGLVAGQASGPGSTSGLEEGVEGGEPPPPEKSHRWLLLLPLALALLAAALVYRRIRASRRRARSAAAEDAIDAPPDGSWLQQPLPADPAEALVAVYVAACAALAAAGIPRSAYETAREFAARVDDTFAPSLGELTLLYEIARHSGAPTTVGALARARSLAAHLREAAGARSGGSGLVA